MVYCFTVYNLEEEIQVNDLLGIDPPGIDIDTYLSRLSLNLLNDWKNYWVGIWTNLNRSDIVNFVIEMYNKYYEEPEPEEVSAEITEFKFRPIILSRLGRDFDWITKIKNTGKSHEINCGMSFFKDNMIIDAPWFKIYNMPFGSEVEVTLGLKLPKDFPMGYWDVVCRVWENSSGGTKVANLDNLGAVYQAGVLTGMLDEKWKRVLVII